MLRELVPPDFLLFFTNLQISNNLRLTLAKSQDSSFSRFDWFLILCPFAVISVDSKRKNKPNIPSKQWQSTQIARKKNKFLLTKMLRLPICAVSMLLSSYNTARFNASGFCFVWNCCISFRFLMWLVGWLVVAVVAIRKRSYKCNCIRI